MGRPLRKDVNGVDVIGTFGTNTPGDKQAGIRVEFHDGSSVQSDGIIVKQRGARTFVVSRVGNVISPLNSTPNKFTRVLVSGTPVAGQMRMVGFLAGTGEKEANGIAIRKITKRVATDFNGVKYTWKMINFEDSTGDVIVLTPVAGA